MENKEERKFYRSLSTKDIVLTAREKHMVKQFRSTGGRRTEPTDWLPPSDTIFNDFYLCKAVLIPALDKGAFGEWTVTRLKRIGFSPDFRPSVRCPSHSEKDRRRTVMEKAKAIAKTAKRSFPVVKSFKSRSKPSAPTPASAPPKEKVSQKRSQPASVGDKTLVKRPKVVNSVLPSPGDDI